MGAEKEMKRENLTEILIISKIYADLEFLATDPEVPGSIPGAARFSG
jgi:hypothetical protein